MTNREFTDLLISRIRDHEKFVCGETGEFEQYRLAHTHIIELIQQELSHVEEIEQAKKLLGQTDEI